jgi:hypothetical protein
VEFLVESAASQGGFGHSEYTGAMSTVVEEIQNLEKQLAHISDDSAEELSDLARNIARLPALLEKVLGVVRDDWFRSDLSWRVQAPYVVEIVLDFAFLLRRFERSFDSLDKATAVNAREAIFQLQGMGVELRGIVKDRIETERRATESLSDNPETESRFRKMHEQGQREIEEGRFEDYTLEEFKEQFG